MQENIDKMHQRGERLVDLQGKTGKISPWIFFYINAF
jgi:hypothetical protein